MTRTLGGYIQQKRDDLGWNQTELAQRSGVPRTTVNRIETGTTKFPAANVRRQLARALGVSHLDLLVAAREITEDEIVPLGVQGAENVDPLKAAIADRLARVRLDEGRYEALEDILDGWIRRDRNAGEHVQHPTGERDHRRVN